MVAGKENEDIEQLEKLEKDQEDMQMLNDDDIFKNITRRTAHISSNIVVKDFTYDSKKFLWCCIKFEVPVKFRNLDMTNVLRDTARTSVIWEVPKIKRAITFKQNDLLSVKTEGINIEVIIVTLLAFSP
jgi:DNA-directed RNA polymerase I subunit RPA1